jgi:hypothetical protein
MGFFFIVLSFFVSFFYKNIGKGGVRVKTNNIRVSWDNNKKTRELTETNRILDEIYIFFLNLHNKKIIFFKLVQFGKKFQTNHSHSRKYFICNLPLFLFYFFASS